MSVTNTSESDHAAHGDSVESRAHAKKSLPVKAPSRSVCSVEKKSMTRGRFRVSPWMTLTLSGTFAAKPSMLAWSLDPFAFVHPSMMQDGHGHERTACTECGPAA